MKTGRKPCGMWMTFCEDGRIVIAWEGRPGEKELFQSYWIHKGCYPVTATYWMVESCHMSAIITVTYDANILWGILINLWVRPRHTRPACLAQNSSAASRWFCLEDDFGRLLLLGTKTAQQAKEDQRRSKHKSPCEYDHTDLNVEKLPTHFV